MTVTAPASSKTITGLTGGTTYTFTVRRSTRSAPGRSRRLERGHADAPNRARAPRRASAPRPGRSGHGQLDDARERRRQPDHRLPGHARTSATTAQAPVSVTGACQLEDDHRAHHRHHLHIQGHRDQRDRRRARLGSLQCGHADHGQPARRADRGHSYGEELRRSAHLDARRRATAVPDHELPNHALHRRCCADGDDDRVERDIGERERPHQRDHLHLHGRRDQRRRRRARFGAIERDHALRDDLRPRGLRRPSTLATAARSSSESSSAATSRGTINGIRFYKVGGQHRHPRRQPLERHRHPARPGQLQPARRPPAGSRSNSRARSRSSQHDLRRRLPGTERPLLGQRPDARRAASTTRRCTRSPTAPSVNGLYAYGSTAKFPTNTYQASNYWVDVLFTPSNPAQAPGAPTGVNATGGQEQATVNWTAPASDGGSTLTSYRVTPYIGTTAQAPVSVSVPATSRTITGLAGGTPYTFKVAATNAVGTGPDSAASNSVTPTAPAAPDAPTGVSATGGQEQATVNWSAPANNGGSPITAYRVTPYIGATAQSAMTVPAPAGSKTITGLAAGTTYTFKVAATNAVGTGPDSRPPTR